MQLHVITCNFVQSCYYLQLRIAMLLASSLSRIFLILVFSSEVACKQREETVCTNTPRHKTSETCKKSEEKVCEEVYERKPYPYSKPHCRNEGKKVCHVEQKTQPKQIKKYR